MGRQKSVKTYFALSTYNYSYRLDKRYINKWVTSTSRFAFFSSTGPLSSLLMILNISASDNAESFFPTLSLSDKFDFVSDGILYNRNEVPMQ